MPEPLQVSIDSHKVATAGHYNSGLIIGAGALTLVAALGAFYAISTGMSWFTVALAMALALGALMVVITSFRRKNLLQILVGDGADIATVMIDDFGVQLAGIPPIPWSAMSFVGVLDDHERTARILRVPLIGWTGALAIKAGNGKIGCEIGVRDGEALRAACTSDAQRRRVSVFNAWPDGSKRGTVGLILDAVLSDSDVPRVINALEAHAAASGVPFHRDTKMFDYFGWKGPMLDPKWD